MVPFKNGRFIFGIVFCAILEFSSGVSPDTMKHCCTLGENYSSSGLDCKSFKPPIAGIEKRDELVCLRAHEVCCKKKIREAQCNLGEEDAKQGTCKSDDGARKECCENCQVGITTGKSGAGCEDLLGLGESFVKCCTEAETATTTTTTTEKPTMSTTKTSLKPEQLEDLNKICDTDVCAQLCTVTNNSYKCSCYPDYVLMADGVSCKPIKTPKKSSRCRLSNPCDQLCIDTGTIVKCDCYEGYKLADDNKTCEDIDECALGVHECEPGDDCVNEDGSYSCYGPELEEGDPFTDCQPGYKFNGTSNTCEDIDECEFDIVCQRPKTCENTIGSYICKGDDRELCPPGYYFKMAINDCADVDECITGDNTCNKDSQVCLNTKGSYNCVDKASKKTCPPGFKKNIVTEICEDINECEESDDVCKKDELCVNESGGHTCVPNPSATTKKPETVSKFTPVASPTRFPPKPIVPVKDASCPKGYRHNGVSCFDINECNEDPEACDSTQTCTNTPGSFVCNCKIGYGRDQTGACADINECQIGTHDCTEVQRCDNTLGSYICSRIIGCGTGYTFNYGSGICEDDNECALGTHNCHSLGADFKCVNLFGTYRCEPKEPEVTPNKNPLLPPSPPTTLRPITPVIPSSTPKVSYDPPKRIPAYSPPYLPPRVPPAYSPVITPPPRSTQSVHAENRQYYIPIYTARLPTLSPAQSYPIIHQQKKCLPGFRMNSRGQCEDINECESNPCAPGQKCVNKNGQYDCLFPKLTCKRGFEPNEAGDKCVDINECSRGIHKCDQSQICKNGEGFYTCECPVGYHLDKQGNSNRCVDIDECRYYRPCGHNSNCENTPGSYKCDCKSGFRTRGSNCDDINECAETPGLCDQKCVNMWGSYRCACDLGFQLSYDNRTCIDIDECEKFKDKQLCLYQCKNIPGSYKCECPRGYRMGNDKALCIDINECNENVCDPMDSCINYGGGYKCYPLHCPPGYVKDTQHVAACKRSTHYCDPRSTRCILEPERYSYQYITVNSDLPITDPVLLFKISSDLDHARTEFIMTLVDVDCQHYDRIDMSYFKKELQGSSAMMLYLTRSPKGPQEAKLQIEMKLYNGNSIIANLVVYVIVLVSEFPF